MAYYLGPWIAAVGAMLCDQINVLIFFTRGQFLRLYLDGHRGCDHLRVVFLAKASALVARGVSGTGSDHFVQCVDEHLVVANDGHALARDHRGALDQRCDRVSDSSRRVLCGAQRRGADQTHVII